MTGRSRQVAVVLAALFNVVMNALAGAGMLLGRDTGAVSDAYPTGLTPAGWAFSIWSVIFVGVLVFAAYQARPAAQGSRYDGLAVPFVVANLLNGLWQLPWLTERFFVSALVIVGILASLAALYVRLDRLGLTKAERWTLGVPISLFLAWISVATALNITVALVAAGWEEPGPWPPLVVLGIAGVGTGLLARTGDVAFAAVLVWAFTAIYAGNVVTLAESPLLAGALCVGVVLFVGAVVYALRRGRSPLPVSG